MLAPQFDLLSDDSGQAIGTFAFLRR